mgnify:FL=1|jgi:hypothetical protein
MTTLPQASGSDAFRGWESKNRIDSGFNDALHRLQGEEFSMRNLLPKENGGAEPLLLFYRTDLDTRVFLAVTS